MNNKLFFVFTILSILIASQARALGLQCAVLFTGSSVKEQTSAEIQTTLDGLVKLYYEINNQNFENPSQLKQANEKLAAELKNLLTLDKDIISRFNELVRLRAKVEKEKARKIEEVNKEKSEAKKHRRLYQPQEKYVIEHESSVYHLMISPDGKHLVTVSGDGVVKVSDFDTGNLIYKFKHKFTVNHSNISPDGKYLVTVSDDKTAKVTDFATGELLFTIKHKDVIYSSSISPNGKFLVTASKDGKARVTDLTTRQKLYEVKHNFSVYHSSISPDGKYLVTASQDGTAKVTDLASGELISLFYTAKVFIVLV
jgi:WD40 repeat protein